MPTPLEEPVGRELTWDEVHEFGLDPVPDGIGPSVDEIAEGDVDVLGNVLDDGTEG